MDRRALPGPANISPPVPEHLIITRFSVRLSNRHELPSKSWVDHRLELLEAYCLPTIASQTLSEFRWLLLCDEGTHDESLQNLGRLLETIPNAEVVLVEPARPFVEGLLQSISAIDDMLITTRLDSDDGLGRHYAERVAAYIEPFRRLGAPAQLLCFSQGCKLDAKSGHIYDTFHPISPVVTLFERADRHRRPHSIYFDSHRYLNRRYPVHHDAAPGPWLQVVHGDNVSNRIHHGDYPLPASVLDKYFEIRAQ